MPPKRPARLEVDMKIGVLGLAAFETAGETRPAFNRSFSDCVRHVLLVWQHS
jgi:hypothetical protein